MIRRATPEDLRLVHHLERACFGRRSFSRQHVAHVLEDPDSTTFIYSEDGAAVACIMLHREGDLMRVVSIGVHPRWRRRGIGEKLMLLAEEEALGARASEVRLEVSTTNRGAIEFYRTLGYGTQGLIPHYYAWGEDAYVMGKDLPAEAREGPARPRRSGEDSPDL